MQLIRILALVRQLAGLADADTLRSLVAALRAGDWVKVAEIVLTVLVGLAAQPRVSGAAPGQPAAALPPDVAAELDAIEADHRARHAA